MKLLEKRQLTCYRCQEKGHLTAECGNECKPRRCFRCKEEGNLVMECVTGEPKGPVGANQKG